MRTRTVLIAFTILLGSIVIAIGTFQLDNTHISATEPNNPVITYRVGYKGTNFETTREIEMEMNGIQIEGMTHLVTLGTLLSFFKTLFWMYVAWRVLKVVERLSTTFDRLQQKKLSNEQDRES